MRENRMDRITNKLRKRVDRLLGSAHKQFKGTNPYRKERIPDEERIMNYMNLTPDVEQELRGQFGDEQVEKMHLNMQELITRSKRNA